MSVKIFWLLMTCLWISGSVNVYAADSTERLSVEYDDAKEKLFKYVVNDLITFVNDNSGIVTTTYFDKAANETIDVDIFTRQQADGGYKLFVDRDNTGLFWRPKNARESKHEVMTLNEMLELGHLFKSYPLSERLKKDISDH